MLHELFFLDPFFHLSLIITISKIVKILRYLLNLITRFIRGGSRAAATSKMERFVILVNGWKPLTIITKHSLLDIAAALDPPLFIIV